MDADLVAHIRAQLTDKDPAVRKEGLAQAKALGDWSPVIEGCGLLGSRGIVDVPFKTGANEATPATEILELLFTSPMFDRSLKRLKLDQYVAQGLNDLEVLKPLTALEELSLNGIDALKNLDTLTNHATLKVLEIEFADSLENVDGLATCAALETINLSHCPRLENLDGLSSHRNLTDFGRASFELLQCTALKSVTGLANLTHLQNLRLISCESLESINPLSKLTSLTHLDLYNCQSLTSIDVVANFQELEELSLWYCQSLRDVSVLRELPKLRKLNVAGCKHLGFNDGAEDSPDFDAANMTTREDVVAWLHSLNS